MMERDDPLDTKRRTDPLRTEEIEEVSSVREEDQTEEIRVEIEQTRTEMSGTIDAIQEKLSPERLREQAKGAVRDATVGKVEGMVSGAGETVEGVVSGAGETARDTTSGVMQTIRQNPIPAALAGLSIAWLWKNRSSGQTYQGGQTSYTQQARSKIGDVADKAGQSASQAQDSAGQMASQARQKVGETASQARQKVGETASQTQETAAQLARGAQYRAQWAQSRLQDQVQQNPLAARAVGLVRGAAVGLAMP